MHDVLTIVSHVLAVIGAGYLLAAYWKKYVAPKRRDRLYLPILNRDLPRIIEEMCALIPKDPQLVFLDAFDTVHVFVTDPYSLRRYYLAVKAKYHDDRIKIWFWPSAPWDWSQFPNGIDVKREPLLAVALTRLHSMAGTVYNMRKEKDRAV